MEKVPVFHTFRKAKILKNGDKIYKWSLSQNPRKQPSTTESGDRKNERNLVRLELSRPPTQGDSR
ncbi:MAG: hypothetical protein LBT33_04685, partial [Spirochaetia bacterium]|nr:hypothetical protein [Spirochaetia bacterium]